MCVGLQVISTQCHYPGSSPVAATYRHFQVQRQDDVTVVHFADPPENQSPHKVQDELIHLVEKARPRKLAVSFRNVSRCTTDMVNALLRSRKRLAAYNGELKLCDMQPAIREVFTMLKLERTVFSIYPTLAEAIREFSA